MHENMPCLVELYDRDGYWSSWWWLRGLVEVVKECDFRIKMDQVAKCVQTQMLDLRHSVSILCI